MARLLSVDWSFFFPVPYGRPEEVLFDWRYRDHSCFVSGLIWAIRDCNFQAAGVQLPTCLNYQNFASRFRFSPGASLYLVEHHAAAVYLLTQYRQNRFTDIVSFDAYHDCGYELMPSSDEEGKIQVDSENWLGAAIRYFDVRAEVVYPDWKDGRTIEMAPQVEPANWSRDCGQSDWHHFDAVLLCHSGANVPPWCDNQWLEFVDSWPETLEKVILEEQADSPRLRALYH